MDSPRRKWARRQRRRPERTPDHTRLGRYDAPEFWTQFAQAYPDVEVDYTYFEQDADALAKLQSGFQVDLLHPCSSWWGLYVDAGLVQPIDTSRLKNWPDVVPEMAKLGEFDGQQYFVPWDWTMSRSRAHRKVEKYPPRGLICGTRPMQGVSPSPTRPRWPR